jgi:hypothetical protein
MHPTFQILKFLPITTILNVYVTAKVQIRTQSTVYIYNECHSWGRLTNTNLIFSILNIFGGLVLEGVGHFFAYVAHFVFWEISGFEPRELP